jgi:hypothetical protein
MPKHDEDLGGIGKKYIDGYSCGQRCFEATAKKSTNIHKKNIPLVRERAGLRPTE